MLAARRAKLVQIGAVAGPGLLVAVMHLVLTPGEPILVASGTTPVLTPVVAPPPKINTEQQQAAAWVWGLDARAVLPSPLDHPKGSAPVPVGPDPEPVKPPPVADPLAGLKLSGMMGTSTGGMATINGKVCKVGEMVRPGCKLVAVDPASNTVEIETDDGQRHTLARTKHP